MATQQHNSALLDLLPDTLVELYELDLGEQDGIYRFHPGIIATEQLFFGDKPYYVLPVDANGFEKKNDGTMARPSLTFANVDGLISDVLKRRGDLVGKTFTRKRVFLKFLDSRNFPSNLNPYAVPDVNSRFDDEIFIVNKKTSENKFYVEFELVTPIEFEDVKIPTRIMIANYCPWKYRGIGCRYGQRPDYNTQEINNDNVSNVSPLDFFSSGGQTLGNLGLPVADENNKLFFEKEGYNITSITWRGDFDKTVSDYVVGDVVRIKSNFTNLAKLELSEPDEDLIDDPDSFFVCIKNAPVNKDPRFEQEYWIKDQCGKNLTACRYRYQLYGEYKRGLPFGGFPSIEVYRFS